jgi:BirA family transcriptional regulator, biotin operon repressor / biotin---[acetyl-CoA-carboxylase] ligase
MHMDEHYLRKALTNVPLGGLRYFEQTGSTNDAALAWAAAGAPDLALVLAEEQTAGRGRGSHAWFTPPDAALAFSLVIRPLPAEERSISLFSALGALAVCEVLAAQGLHPEIKWPNDVLLHRKKICGILAESVWTGEKVDSLVLGVGLNIAPAALPPPDQLSFPATCLEAELPPPRHVVPAFERVLLLQQILQAIRYWRNLLPTIIFLHTWERRLAFRGEQVQVWAAGQAARKGQVDGLEKDGSLRLLSPQGQVFTVQFGEVHLRPVV